MRIDIKRGSLPLMILAAVVVSGATCATQTPDRVPLGTWGGEHIGMVVADTGALIEYDCAAGRITQPLLLDASGAFTWEGFHTPGQGGPVRDNETPPMYPARYTGRATRDRLTVTLTANLPSQIMTQTFVLTRGAPAGVFKCL